MKLITSLQSQNSHLRLIPQEFWDCIKPKLLFLQFFIMTRIYCAGLITLKNRKLLLAFSKNKQAYYLPGGKIDKGETAQQALIREIKEELNIEFKESDIEYYCHITAKAFGEANGLVMEQDCFICGLDDTPKPNAEIAALQYFDEAGYRNEQHLVPGVIMAFEQLRKDGLVD